MFGASNHEIHAAFKLHSHSRCICEGVPKHHLDRGAQNDSSGFRTFVNCTYGAHGLHRVFACATDCDLSAGSYAGDERTGYQACGGDLQREHFVRPLLRDVSECGEPFDGCVEVYGCDGNADQHCELRDEPGVADGESEFEHCEWYGGDESVSAGCKPGRHQRPGP